MSPTPFLAGNWKMNGSLAANRQLLQGVLASLLTTLPTLPSRLRVAVFPPFPYLMQCADLLATGAVGFGSQDISPHAAGAYTGEVAASMVADLGGRYALVGHSERRHYHRENDFLVGQKAKAAVTAGLTALLCVGETLEDRDGGNTEAVIARQLQGAFAVLSARDFQSVVIAYEPVWAIGTGRAASPDMAQEVHGFIRNMVSVHIGAAFSQPILYGGSVKPDNAEAIFAMPDIDGALVGGASLKAEDFLAIGQALLNQRA